MDDITRVKYLPIALRAIGLFFIFGTYPMMIWSWPPGWGWISPYLEYQQLALVTHVTLGVFLILAAQNLATNFSLIWFTICLNLASATLMLLLVIANRTGEANLAGAIFVQYLVSGILWNLMPRHVKRLQQQEFKNDGE